MAKIVPLNGTRPAGWAKDRWRWIGLVRRSPDLSPMTKIVAHALAEGFANWETGECRPGFAALERDCSAGRSTVKRAIRQLEAAGWVERLGGNAPGKSSAIRFTFAGEKATEQGPAVTPEQGPAVTPEQGPAVTPEQGPAVTPEQGPKMTATGSKSAPPPRPPYIAEPNMNHKYPPRNAMRKTVPGGLRPSVISHFVQTGTDAEADWNRWLVENGFPTLDQIGRQLVNGMLEGWDMPSRWPPGASDETGHKISTRFARWLVERR